MITGFMTVAIAVGLAITVAHLWPAPPRARVYDKDGRLVSWKKSGE